MISKVHLSPRTSSERATGQLDRPCLMCVGMTAMLAHKKGRSLPPPRSGMHSCAAACTHVFGRSSRQTATARIPSGIYDCKSSSHHLRLNRPARVGTSPTGRHRIVEQVVGAGVLPLLGRGVRGAEPPHAARDLGGRARSIGEVTGSEFLRVSAVPTGMGGADGHQTRSDCGCPVAPPRARSSPWRRSRARHRPVPGLHRSRLRRAHPLCDGMFRNHRSRRV